MIDMGFDARWVATIMKCVSAVSYSVVVNSSIGDSLKPSRGLC